VRYTLLAIAAVASGLLLWARAAAPHALPIVAIAISAVIFFSALPIILGVRSRRTIAPPGGDRIIVRPPASRPASTPPHAPS